MKLSRRIFIKLSTTAAAGGGALTGPATDASAASVMVAQAMSPTPSGFNPADPSLKYDLVVAGGDVLDPSVRRTCRLRSR
jgi:hypothetical protein